MNWAVLFLRRIRAFLARDWRLEISYKMQFFLRILSILIVVTTLFFISKIFTGFAFQWGVDDDDGNFFIMCRRHR